VRLDLPTGSGDITVKAGNSNQVVIHGRISSNNEWFSNSEGAVRQVESNPPIQQNGNDIRIGYNLPEDVKRHVSISYEVTVPADATVQAHSGSGGVNLESIRGEVQAQTGSGAIRLAIGSGGFNLDVHTGSGSINSGLPVTMQGSIGRRELKGSVRGGGPEVAVSTGSGDVDIR